MDINFYLYIFILITWFLYILNSIYQNYRIKKFLPDKKIEILTIPFYIFFTFSFYLSIQKVANIILINSKDVSINFGSLWVTISVTVGTIFCLFSILLYSYISFFVKSFPSCLAIKNGQRLRGIYNYIRHPSYYIFFFITFGNVLCLQSKSLFILACINHTCLYFYYMLEENQIRKTNPYYNEYLKETNRFLPNFLRINR